MSLADLLLSLLPPPPPGALSPPASQTSTLELFHLLTPNDPLNPTPTAIGLRYLPRTPTKCKSLTNPLPYTITATVLPPDPTPIPTNPKLYRARITTDPTPYPTPFTISSSNPPIIHLQVSQTTPLTCPSPLLFSYSSSVSLAMVTDNVYEEYVQYLAGLVSEGEYEVRVTGGRVGSTLTATPPPPPATTEYRPYSILSGDAVLQSEVAGEEFVHSTLHHFASKFVVMSPPTSVKTRGGVVLHAAPGCDGVSAVVSGSEEFGVAKNYAVRIGSCVDGDTTIETVNKCMCEDALEGVYYVPDGTAYFRVPAAANQTVFATRAVITTLSHIPLPPVLDPTVSNPTTALDYVLSVWIIGMCCLGALVVARKARFLNVKRRLWVVDWIVASTEPEWSEFVKEKGEYDQVGYDGEDEVSDCEQERGLVERNSLGGAVNAFGLVDSDRDEEEGGDSYVRMADLKGGSCPATPFGKKIVGGSFVEDEGL